MMEIRQFSFDEDLDDVRLLWSQSGPGVQLSYSDEPEEIQKKIARDPDLFLIAEVDGRMVGTVIGGFDGRRGMVYHLAVHTEFQRRGIATALMKEVEDRLRSKGCKKFYIMVQKAATGALEFYEDYGCEKMDIHLLGKMTS